MNVRVTLENIGKYDYLLGRKKSAKITEIVSALGEKLKGRTAPEEPNKCFCNVGSEWAKSIVPTSTCF